MQVIKEKEHHKTTYYVYRNEREEQYGASVDELQDAAPLNGNYHFNKAMDAIRAFELTQMSYTIIIATYVTKEAQI